MAWKEDEEPTVDEAAKQLRQYEESLSSSLQACVSAVEKLSEEVHQLKENLSSSPPEPTSVHRPKENTWEKTLSEKFHQLEERLFSSAPVQSSVSAVRGRRSPTQGRRYGGYSPRATLWFYLRDHGEDMRKWDGKSTATLEARVRELQKKTIRKKGFSEKFAAPTSSRQSFKHRNKKETQTFLGVVGFWRMHIPNYSLIVNPLYQVTRKKNEFEWGPEQRQAFEQIKQEIVHAVALGPVRTGPDVKNVLYTAAGENGPTWSLWQKEPGETRGRPLGFWSRGYRGSEARYTPTEKEILAAYEGVRSASEVVGTEAQLLLAPRLPVLGWMFKGRVPSTHHATDATWSKWVALITQRARIGNPSRPGILEVIMDWPEGKYFGISSEEEVGRAEEAPLYNQLPENEKKYALFTDGSCRIVGKHRRWKAAVWSPTRRVAEAAEGEGESSQFAEVKAIQLALDIAEREKWPVLYLYTDSWMVANALWGWLQQWKQNNWQRRGKPIWAAALWQDIAARVENLAVKVRHVDAHVPKNRATEEHQNNQQVDQAAKIEVAQVDLDWQHKGELFIARWAHDTSGHQGRDATYRWARDRGVDLTMDAIAQVIHDCETCAAIKQAKRSKPLWYGGRWLKYKYGEAWQIDYITLPQTRNGKRHVLTMVEATTGWLETYPVPHATARNTILGLEKQVLWRHGTPERIESDNGTHFRNNLIDTWAKEHGIEWVYHIPYHAPASGKVERYNGLLKTTLKAMGAGTFKNWDTHLAKATWLVNTRGSTNRAGPAQSNLLRTVDGDKVPVVHVKNMLGKTVWATPASGKGKPIPGIVFAQGPGYTWWVMQKNGEVRCVPQGDLILGENSP
uniref:Uncharacterized protein n=1 Tax=Anas platyrhynchos TaxID=8839 RepID=A0A8B9QXY9_ANAPL